MTTPTKFTGIALVLFDSAAFALQRFDQRTSPAQTEERLVVAAARGDASTMRGILTTEPDGFDGDEAFADPIARAIAAIVTLHRVHEVEANGTDQATVQVDASHVPIGEIFGIALVAGLTSSFGGGEEVWQEAEAAITVLPASARSTRSRGEATHGGSRWIAATANSS